VSAAQDSVLCPICHTEKQRGQATCSKCGVKSCPNGHVFSPDSTKCPQCGWEEWGWKPSKEASTHETADIRGTEATDTKIIHICPKCYTKINSKYGRCPNCGYLKSL
jgi:hypothetical protein